MSEVAHKPTSAEVPAIFHRSPSIGSLAVARLNHERQHVTVGVSRRDELERRPDSRRVRGAPMAAFIAIAGELAIGMLVGGRAATINLARPIARLRRRSRTLGLVAIEVVDDQDELVALGRGTYANTPV